MTMTAPVCAELYKWIDANGNTHYGDQPPADSDLLEIGGNLSSYTHPETAPLPGDFFDHLKKSHAHTVRVIMYSAQWCGVCKRAKSYLQAHGIAFTEKDIDASEQTKAEFERLGGKGVPVFLIGRQRMNGFSEALFEQLYKQAQRK